MSLSGFVIAGTHSGCGKTSVSMALMAALVKRGFSVQPFKIGPDFIDPGHHKRITGRISHNLDGWIMGINENIDIVDRYGHEADFVAIEGVMGLFDGFSGNSEAGSTAQMAKWLGLPVLLVLDARSMARSIAALAQGFVDFDPDLNVLGLIVNRVGSDKHRDMLAQSLQDNLSTRIYGYLPREEKLKIPSRHLGLITDEDWPSDQKRIEVMVDWIEKNVCLDEIIKDCQTDKNILTPKDQQGPGNKSKRSSKTLTRIGIARDEAFCFYYAENLRLLEEAGAELIPFSPIRDNRLPSKVQGLYFGGGYPELHCPLLSQNRSLLSEIYDFGINKGVIYGECGGFMYLTRSIFDLNGRRHSMAGLLPIQTGMDSRLRSLGYRQITTQRRSILGPPGTRVRGHEFHYSHILGSTDRMASIYLVLNQDQSEGFLRNNVLGSYIHLHWGSNHEVATSFVEFCKLSS